LAACLAVGLSGTCRAQDLKAQQKFTETEIGFEILGPYANLSSGSTRWSGSFRQDRPDAIPPALRKKAGRRCDWRTCMASLTG
jgi:hypothetical protein